MEAMPISSFTSLATYLQRWLTELRAGGGGEDIFARPWDPISLGALLQCKKQYKFVRRSKSCSLFIPNCRNCRA